MIETAILTVQDANEILNILSELPIRYLTIVQTIQKLLASKFVDNTTMKEHNVTDTLTGK